MWITSLATVVLLQSSPATSTTETAATASEPAKSAAVVGERATQEEVPAEARSLIAEATLLLQSGDRSGARAKVEAARALLTGSPWLASFLQQIELQLAATPKKPLTRTEAEREDESVADVYTTLALYGAYSGAWLFGILLEMDVRAVVPLSVVTAAGGIALTYALDHHDGGLAGGTASGISEGMVTGWGLAMLGLAAYAEDISAKEFSSIVWGSIGAGGLAGGLLAESAGASRGQVALVSNGWAWGAVFGTTVSLIVLPDVDDTFKGAFWGSVAGIGAGMGAATQIDPPRSRVLYTSLGGIMGALVGAAVIVTTELDERRGIGGVMTGSIAAGLATTWYITAPDDTGDALASTQLVPMLLQQPGDPTRVVSGLGLVTAW